jgi:hypothetical protein
MIISLTWLVLVLNEIVFFSMVFVCIELNPSGIWKNKDLINFKKLKQEWFFQIGNNLEQLRHNLSVFLIVFVFDIFNLNFYFCYFGLEVVSEKIREFFVNRRFSDALSEMIKQILANRRFSDILSEMIKQILANRRFSDILSEMIRKNGKIGEFLIKFWNLIISDITQKLNFFGNLTKNWQKLTKNRQNLRKNE